MAACWCLNLYGNLYVMWMLYIFKWVKFLFTLEDVHIAEYQGTLSLLESVGYLMLSLHVNEGWFSLLM